MRRAYITAIMGLGIVLGVRITPAYQKVVSSTQTVQHYFENLRQGGSRLTPVERFVFSLILSNAESPRTENQGTARARRT